MEVYDIVVCFFIYGFLGWCTEVAFAAAKEKKFVNRGFLNGPICPIYGVGVVAVVLLLEPYRSNFLMLYVASIVVVTALEWATGFVLEKLFHNKWWDYSNMPLNLNGYVCLLFSLIWGVACVCIVRWIHPLIFQAERLLPHWLGITLAVVLSAVMAVDLYVTASRILKMNRGLERMEEIAAELRRISDGLGENIYKDVLGAMELKDGKVQELKDRYHELAQKNAKAARRLLRAFPRMKPGRHREVFEDLKRYLKRK